MPIRLVLALLLLALPAARAEAGRHPPPEQGAYITVDTLTATVIAPNGRRQVMTVQAGIYVADETLRAYARSVQPRLRDGYARALQVYAGGLTPGAPPDPDYLGRRLQEATDRVLGRPGGRFLFGGMMVN